MAKNLKVLERRLERNQARGARLQEEISLIHERQGQKWLNKIYKQGAISLGEKCWVKLTEEGMQRPEFKKFFGKEQPNKLGYFKTDLCYLLGEVVWPISRREGMLGVTGCFEDQKIYLVEPKR